MSFSDTFRNIALVPELVPELFPNLLGAFGEISMDGEHEVPTIGEYWDDSPHAKKRAARYSVDPITGKENGTIRGTLLTDGRVSYRFMPQSDLEAEFLADGIPGVEELTDEQVAALTPPPSEIS